MEQKPYGVYVRTDDAGRITAINSDAFLPSADGWTKIDEGYGDRYHHAQSNYTPQPLRDMRGICSYKLADGKVVERTQAEMDADYTPPEPPVDEIAALRAQIAALTVRQEAQEADSGVIHEALMTGGLVAAPVAGEAWDAAKWYRSGDTVMYQDVGYTCRKTCKGKEPGADSLIAYWEATPKEEPGPVLAWGEIAGGEMILVGQIVTHNDKTWRCVKAHARSVIRQPSAVQEEYWEAVT